MSSWCRLRRAGVSSPSVPTSTPLAGAPGAAQRGRHPAAPRTECGAASSGRRPPRSCRAGNGRLVASAVTTSTLVPASRAASFAAKPVSSSTAVPGGVPPQDIGRQAGTRADLQQVIAQVEIFENPRQQLGLHHHRPLRTGAKRQMLLVHECSYPRLAAAADAVHRVSLPCPPTIFARSPAHRGRQVPGARCRAPVPCTPCRAPRLLSSGWLDVRLPYLRRMWHDHA